ncbi:MAG: hypothetical protein HOE50_00235 [Chloroflexi bacterium]|jgi:hypothetical protein|nr:hypothetical protein [Chloroflexota bacterium]MBT5894020.1 hypothetical protein [Chloroflexota bacterium]
MVASVGNKRPIIDSTRNNLELLITDAAREYLDRRERPVAIDYLTGLG